MNHCWSIDRFSSKSSAVFSHYQMFLLLQLTNGQIWWKLRAILRIIPWAERMTIWNLQSSRAMLFNLLRSWSPLRIIFSSPSTPQETCFWRLTFFISFVLLFRSAAFLKVFLHPFSCRVPQRVLLLPSLFMPPPPSLSSAFLLFIFLLLLSQTASIGM